jgi:hypothetical protein
VSPKESQFLDRFTLGDDPKFEIACHADPAAVTMSQIDAPWCRGAGRTTGRFSVIDQEAF